MARTNFDIIRGLMIADNTLDSWICETEAEEKRNLTAEEENTYIQNTVDICKEIMQDLSCSLVEAYKDVYKRQGVVFMYPLYCRLEVYDLCD